MKLKHKFLSMVILLVAVLTSVFVPSFEGAAQHIVTDNKSGRTFTITENASEITINADSTQSTIYIDSRIIDICCYDKKLTFLCATETVQDNFVYTIYNYNIESGILSSFPTNCKASNSNKIFAADGSERVYILSYYDSSVILCCENGKAEKEIKCNSNIVQMMGITQDSVLLFTVDGVYSLKNYALTKLSSLVPVSPCSFAGNGIIVDNTGCKYAFSANNFELYKETTNSNNENASKSDIKIDHKGNLITLSEPTTIAKLRNSLAVDSGHISVQKADGSTVTSGRAGTGMKLIAEDKIYHLIIKGDLTGEGNINSRDLKALMKHLTQEESLAGIFLTAADLDDDNEISTKDLLALAKLY